MHYLLKNLGQKGSVWEGGCRVPACIYSPLIKNNHRITDEFMYITDILPTMAAAANINLGHKKLDGVSQWKTITDNEPSTRKEILYNIEPVLGFSAIMNDGWKLVNGSANFKNSNWFGSSGENANMTVKSYIDLVLNSETAANLPKLSESIIKEMQEKSITKCDKLLQITKCNSMKSPCLFNIIEDPCEYNNLADIFPEKVQFLTSRLSHHLSEMVPSRRKPSDLNCDPKFHNFTWTWWLGEDEIKRDGNFCFFMTCLIFLAIFLLFMLSKKLLFNPKNYARKS